MTLRLPKVLSVLIAVKFLLAAAPLQAADPEANTWQPTFEGQGGTIAGITYLPDQASMLYFGSPPPKSTLSDLRLYHPDTRQWTEPMPGRGPHQARATFTTVFSRDARPGLPAINRPYWLAHQSVYVPPLKKVLFFAGGSTFTYDPQSNRWEDLSIPLDQSPPDVMLGTMAWDPVGKRVILFGGGYISAFKSGGGNTKITALNGKPWSPADWTLSEKRATWAFDPETRRWKKIATGSVSFNRLHESAGRLITQIETLAGATRGIALEYGDRVSGKPAPAIAEDIQALLTDLSGFADRLDRDETCESGYEKQQCKSATVRLREVDRELRPAVASLRDNDGWKALHALETSRRTLVEVAEDLAPSPLPRYYGNLVADTRNKLLVLFGGHGGDRIFADTWVFDSARNQWRQSRATGHPPPTAIPALSFDDEQGVVLLSSGWIYDSGRDEWRRVPITLPKGFFQPWTALDYDRRQRLHVALTTGDNLAEPDALRVAHLRLDPKAARPADFTGPRWIWADDKYLRSWSALPKNQAEYRARVAAHKATLDNLTTNTWTRIDTKYKAQDRSYGSFALDPERGQLVFWGGGHSAYMGNEVSQYDIKGNLWLESWPPEMPPWPFGSPDGDGWNPPFHQRKGASHGYHSYAYSNELDKILFGTQAYDADRMRWSDLSVRKSGSGTLGSAVDMSGADGFYLVSTKHWYGGPFGVWRFDKASGELVRIPGSDTPFSSNDRAKPVFDSKRKRILFYGAREGSENTLANQLYAFDLGSGNWSKRPIMVAAPDSQAPASTAWGLAYSEKYDALLMLPGSKKQDTWLFDNATSTLQRFGPGPGSGKVSTNGLVYSAENDLFITLETGREGIGPVTVHMLRLKR